MKEKVRDKETDKLMREKARRIGVKIKYYRTLKGENQTVFSDKLGVSYQYLSRIECGKQNPSLPLLVKIAGLLEVDLADLVSDTL